MRTSMLIAASLLSLGLAACGSPGGGPAITDASGNRVQIGGDTASVGGPGSPGWPTPSASQAGR
jgi:hypothetical protein